MRQKRRVLSWRGKEGKGRGDWGDKEFPFFFHPPPFFAHATQVKRHLGLLFLVIKTVGQLFFRFGPTLLYSDRGETT